MSAARKSGILAEKSDFNILAPSGSASRVSKARSTAKKAKKAKSTKKPLITPLVIDKEVTFFDENASFFDTDTGKKAVDNFPAERPITPKKVVCTTKQEPTATEENMKDGAVEVPAPVPISMPRTPLARTMSAQNLLKSPPLLSPPLLSPRRHSCDTSAMKMEQFNTHNDAKHAGHTPIAMRSTPRRLCTKLTVSAAAKMVVPVHDMHAHCSHCTSTTSTTSIMTAMSNNTAVAGPSATPERPKRVGGGFVSPSLTSPPSEIPASRAAQGRVNRRFSTIKSKPCESMTPSTDHEEHEEVFAFNAEEELLAQMPASMGFLSPIPNAAGFCSASFDHSPFLCTETVPQQLQASNQHDGEEHEEAFTFDAEEEQEVPVLAPVGFASPIPNAAAFCSASFDHSPFLCTEAVPQQLQTPNQQEGDAIENSVTAPFAKFQAAADRQNAAAVHAAVPQPIFFPDPFSPATVLKSAGVHSAMCSPLGLDHGVHLAPQLSTVQPEQTIAHRFVFLASIERTELRGGLWDKHTVYVIRTQVIQGQMVVSANIVERRYRDFLALYNGLNQCHSVDGTAASDCLSTSLSTSLRSMSIPPKVPFLPCRDSVVQERLRNFRALLGLITCACSGVRSLNSVPQPVRAFFGIFSK